MAVLASSRPPPLASLWKRDYCRAPSSRRDGRNLHPYPQCSTSVPLHSFCQQIIISAEFPLFSSERAFLCPRLRRFTTLENSGLLFYNGRFNEKHDFIALEIQEGQVVLKYSTGTWSVSLMK